MKRGITVGIGLLVLVALSMFVWSRGRESNRLTGESVGALLDRLAQAASEAERDALVDELGNRGEAIVEPLLTRYPGEPAESQLRMNTATVLARLPRAAAIAALEKLARLEPEEGLRGAIRGQIHMLQRAEAPPAGE
ncbi:MAG: HEAT repeat domain-containing protein [Phycisphaerae bacterium]